MIKKTILMMLSFLLLLSNVTSVNALEESKFIDDEAYHVVNINDKGKIKEYISKDNYEDALLFYEKKKKKASNAAIYYKQKFIVMEYGIARIKRDNQCTYNVEYTNIDNGENGYTNGCYGVDGAYLSTDYENQKIKFRISDVNASANWNDIEIMPWLKDSELSNYEVVNGELIHHIKTDFSYRGFNASVTLGAAPLYLKEKHAYYSYDGQYFYKQKDYKKMIDDYRSHHFNHAINSNKPFYNYYQYLPHRSVSNYSAQELNQYIAQKIGITTSIATYVDEDHNGIHDGLNQSLFYNSGDAFLQYQSIYGANALMMMAVARNESASGRSAIAYTKNNLFGHSAFDSDAQASAARYFNPAQSIGSHAKNYISGSYGNPEKFMYHGSFFGNKESGMNVSYASDPYWGEKAAQYTYLIDRDLGEKDLNYYCLGIKDNFMPVSVYKKSEEESEVLYEVKMADYAFLILDKIDKNNNTWYKIQTDPVLKKSEKQPYDYNFNKNIGYIKASDVQSILNKHQIKKPKNYINITFDAGRGSFDFDKKRCVLQVNKGSLPSITNPTAAHYQFVKWDKEIQPANKTRTYKAKWKQVDKISWKKKPKTNYLEGDKLDVSNASILVEYKDGSQKTIALSGDMMVDYNLNEVGKKTWHVETCGYQLKLKVKISKNTKKVKQEETYQAIQEVIQRYQNCKHFTKKDKKLIQNLQHKIKKYELDDISVESLRSLDRIYKKAFKQIEVNIQGMEGTAFSGLREMLDEKALKQADTKINVELKKGCDGSHKVSLKRISEANDYILDRYVSLRITAQDEVLDDFNPGVLVSIPKASDASKSSQYIVLREAKGNVFRVKTYQSKTKIQFIAKHNGTYAITHVINHSMKEASDVKEVDE
ncbi:MAG: glucosaminidase domain-containing protein [Erysipelotrichaceae bacterium]